MIAAARGMTKAMKRLLDCSAATGMQDKAGQTALIMASAIGSVEAVKLLLDHGWGYH